MRGGLRWSWIGLGGVIAALWVGALLRVAGVGQMRGMLHFDEAYNWLDALSLLEAPRFVPFFPGNFGRESGWMYLLTPAVAIFDDELLGVRLVGVLSGVLTLAAVHALARQVIGRRAGPWALAGLGALYVHVHLSHLVLRGLLLPLVGALAGAVLWRASRGNRRRTWLLGGLLTGLLAYTYFSARAWIVYLLLTLVWWARARERRAGALLAGAGALVVMLPALLYTAFHPAEALHRASDVAVLDPGGVFQNLVIWMGALLGQGDATAQWNIPGRPLLDVPLAILGLAGLAALILPARGQRATLPRFERVWLAGLALVSVAPSLLSDRAPHFLRAIGLVVPLALLIGLGAVALGDWLRRAPGPRWVVPLLLVAWAGADSLLAFQSWLRRPEVFDLMEQPVHQSVDVILATVAEPLPVYFAPFTPSHPIVRYSAYRLNGHPTGAFDANGCQVVAGRPAIYVVLDRYQPTLAAELARWGALTTLDHDLAETPARYSVTRFTPEASGLASSSWSEFGGMVEVALVEPLPELIQPGERLAIQLAFRARMALDRPYSAFIHLYGPVPPAEGGPILAQGDAQVCVTYPSDLWRPEETIVQTFFVQVPADLAADSVTLAMGLYESPAGSVLPITEPEGASFIPLQRLTVKSPGALDGSVQGG